MIVLGIDPGGAGTGLVLVNTGADAVLAHRLVEREDRDEVAAYLDRLTTAIEELLAADAPVPELVAIEGLVEPSGHLGIANTRGLLDAAEALGWVRCYCRGLPVPTIIVRPGGHGAAPLNAYPSELASARERKGTGRLRHVRSAFDVARAGAKLHRHAALPGRLG